MNISIVIANYNGIAYLYNCLFSIEKALRDYRFNKEVILVDNGSNDGSKEFINNNFPKIRIIALKQNLGFSKAMNIGIKEARHPIVIGLNNDVMVEKDFITPLLSHFYNDTHIFAVASKMLFWSNKKLNFGQAKASFWLGLLKIKFKDVDRPTNSLYACGGAFAVDRERFLMLGGFDEDLCYYEDVDLCWRAWRRGWRTVFEPQSLVYHKYQGTASKIYGKYGVLVLSKKNYFLFIWKNIHDRFIILQHIFFMPFWLFISMCSFKFYFLIGFFQACKKIKLFLKKRHIEMFKNRVYSDQLIFKEALKSPLNKSKKLKILQIGKFYFPFLGGTECHLHTLVNSLDKKDLIVDVLVSNTSFKTEIFKHNGSRIFKIANIGTIFSQPLPLALPFWLKRLKGDILHFHLPNMISIFSYLLIRPKGKLVVTYHSDIVKQKFLLPLFTPFIEKFLKLADVIMPTSHIQLENSKILRKFKDKCVVIPYGIDLQKFLLTDKIAQKASLIKECYKHPIILFVGRLVYYKGLEYLIQAMKQIDASLLIIGDGPLKNRLKRLSVEFGVQNKIFWIGSVDNENVASYYYASDIVVLPSSIEAESFGIVQVEAFACGKPVVSTKLPTGVTFVNQNEKTGLVVPPKDSKALSQAINTLLKSEELCKKYGSIAKVRVKNEFTKEKMADEVVKIYSELKEI